MWSNSWLSNSRLSCLLLTHSYLLGWWCYGQNCSEVPTGPLEAQRHILPTLGAHQVLLINTWTPSAIVPQLCQLLIPMPQEPAAFLDPLPHWRPWPLPCSIAYTWPSSSLGETPLYSSSPCLRVCLHLSVSLRIHDDVMPGNIYVPACAHYMQASEECSPINVCVHLPVSIYTCICMWPSGWIVGRHF